MGSGHWVVVGSSATWLLGCLSFSGSTSVSVFRLVLLEVLHQTQSLYWLRVCAGRCRTTSTIVHFVYATTTAWPTTSSPFTATSSCATSDIQQFHRTETKLPVTTRHCSGTMD